VADDRVSYGVPALLQARTYAVVLFTLALALGVTGELAACGRILLPAFWIPLLTACRYVAVLLAAVRYGPKIGLGAAVLAGIAHVTANTIVCAQAISQQGEVAAFIVVGLLAGFFVKNARMGAGSEFSPARPGQAALQDRGEASQNADAAGDVQIPVGFVQAARAPLSAIESAGYVLEDATLTDENHQEVAAIILRECHRLDVLIRPLEFVPTRLAVYREVELSSMLDEIVRRGGPLTEAARITLRKEDCLGMRLICDSDLVEQAVLNLLANSIRLVEQGEEIVLSARSSMNNAVIEISHRRIGVLGQLGITMAAVPQGALHGHQPGVDAPLKPEVRNQ